MRTVEMMRKPPTSAAKRGLDYAWNL